MNMPTPVTMMDSAELQSMAPTSLIDGLDQMPQFLNNKTPAAHDVYGEASNLLNLRGIGPNRTLVLLDGRRVVSSTRSGAVDVSILPEELVQRVEVVTGGASAAYGSDAVSGVVNFILDRDFTGVRGNIQGGITERGDNENGKISLSMGTPVGEKSHLLVSGQYFQMDGIKGYDGRDWFQHWGLLPNSDPNGPARLTRRNMRLSAYTYGGLITDGPLAGTQFVEGGVPVPFDYGEGSNGGLQVGGSGPDPNSEYYWLVPDQKRGSIFSRFTADVSDNFSAYVQGFMGYNKSGSGSFPNPQSGPWALTIFDDNAFLPDSIRQRMADEGIESFRFERSTADLEADRYYSSRNRTISLTAGFDGEASGIIYNAYYQYGQNKQHHDYGNGQVLRVDRLPRALDSILDPATGRIVCRSTLSFPDDGCVPLNLFGNGSPSQEAMDYVRADSYHDQKVEQHFAEATAQADIFETWAGVVSLAGGASYRKDSFRQTAGPEDLVELDALPGEVWGYRGHPSIYVGPDLFNRGNPNEGRPEPVLGSFNVWEVFAETSVPLARDISFARSLDLSLAGRYADYSGSGGIWAWKVGLDWQITEDFRLRGTRSRDTRAGTLSERYDRTGGGGIVEYDPLYPDDEPGRLVTLVTGGNPNVGPEKADTLTFGGVYQPSWFAGFALSVDYYDIKIKDAIDQLGAQQIIDQCAEGAMALCDQITRDPDDNRIVEVRDLFLNVAQARTRGIDFEMSYRTSVNIFGGAEDVSLRGFVTHIMEDSITNLGAPKVDRAGETSGGLGRDTVPHWTGTASLTYNIDAWRFFVQQRYISSGKYNVTWTEGVDIDNNRISSAWYTNAQVSYDFTALGGEKELYFNVTNVFDKNPPLVPNASSYTGTTPTNRALFDMLGRRYTLGLRFTY